MDRRTFKFLLKSHRLLGLFLIAFILLLSTTGIALNHTEALGMTKAKVPGFIAARYYSDVDVMGFEVKGQYFYALDGQLHIDRVAVVSASCDVLLGAVVMADQAVALCDDELLFLTPQFELIEKMGQVYGVPPEATGLSTVSLVSAGQVMRELIVLKTPLGDMSFDSVELVASHVDMPVIYADLVPVPNKYALAESVSWQQFILDLHSGIFVGNVGKWLMDLVAVLLILMAFSGFFMWRRFH